MPPLAPPDDPSRPGSARAARITTSRARLTLLVDEDEASAASPLGVTKTLHAHIDAIGAALSTWGEFREPVRVEVLGSTDIVLERAGSREAPWLRGVAERDRVTLVAPSLWDERCSVGRLVQLLKHELAHALTFQRTTREGTPRPVGLPFWFVEGLAQVAADELPPVHVRRTLGEHPASLLLLRPPRDLLAAMPATCYAASADAFRQWMEVFGHARLNAILTAARHGRPFAQAYERVIGAPIDRFEMEWTERAQAAAASE